MNLKEVINIEVNNMLIELKTKFNFNDFINIKNIKDKIVYANKHLNKDTRYLGHGSSRIVFLLSNNSVLKLARPNRFLKGLAQNKAEVEIYKNYNIRPIVTKILDFDIGYQWIISEIARPLKNEKEFEKITNISFTIFKDIMWVSKKLNLLYEDMVKYTTLLNDKSSEKFINVILNNKEILEPIFLLLNNVKMFLPDLYNYKHWGKTVDGRIVLLDYGATEEVYFSHY